MSEPWIAVDLDGTLAKYDGWRGYAHVGEPIIPMVERVKGWLERGSTVKIFTARVGAVDDGLASKEQVFAPIEKWCQEHIGQVLEITNRKNFGLCALWDDMCVPVEANTGRILLKEEQA